MKFEKTTGAGKGPSGRPSARRSGASTALVNMNFRWYLRKLLNATVARVPPGVRALVPHRWKEQFRAVLRPDVSYQRIQSIRQKLLSLGFADRPLAEFDTIMRFDPVPAIRANAARELALWHMRQATEANWRRALEMIDLARRDAIDHTFRCKLVAAELLCYHFLGEVQAGQAAYARAARASEVTPDVMLAWVNFQPTPEGRVTRINEMLNHYGIEPLALLPDDGTPPYDRLTCAGDLPKVTGGPKVTVLIAAYECAATLPTALRAVQEQTWQNLEIIVIDDASPTPGTADVAERFAAVDPRIRVIRMEENGGAYVARNRGLEEATGELVTLHDADDWAHPRRIETQVRFMEGAPQVMGCLTEQARATPDLHFTRWTGRGQFLMTNTSSFLFRRAEMRAHLGYWDSVRFSADSELIRRFSIVFGENAVVRIRSTPLSFPRASDGSMVADGFLGAFGLFFGARRHYLEAQHLHHVSGADLKYDGDPAVRPFPVPEIMRQSKAERAMPRHFDVILASEFRIKGGSTLSNAEELHCQKRAGLASGIFPMARYDLDHHDRPIAPEVWDQVDGKNLAVLAYGETVSCDLLILRYPPILQHRQRYLPQIDAKEIRVIVNQPPMSDYGPEGVLRYDLQSCAENIRHYFGKDAIWHPIGPLVREALHTHHADELHHIELSPEDWHNIIDIEGWDRGPRRRDPTDRLRIGRHSRDHEHKWPARRSEILAAYPDRNDVEVHVLGGAEVPACRIGRLPANWVVHPFGALHPRDFLRDIDVFVYFTHPDWIESFGRTIIEAMAVGVPVILPKAYWPLFGEAAIYATPQTATEAARRLHDDPAAYAEQAKKAQDLVMRRFSYETHLRRIGALKEDALLRLSP